MSGKALIKVGSPVHQFSPSLPIHGLLLVSGAGGGFHGPAGLYDDLRYTLSNNPHYPIVTVQMDYRRPADLRMSIEDIIETMKYMKEKYNVSTVTLGGWSFGGAVVISGAGQVMLDHNQKNQYKDKDIASNNDNNNPYPIVRGIFTVGSQTYGTDAIHDLHTSNIHCLFMHGKSDTCLSAACSEQLYRHYSGKNKQLILYKGDDHGCSQHKTDVIRRITQFVYNIITNDYTAAHDLASIPPSLPSDENVSPNRQEV